MFERFTDRARRVVVLAQDEARDLKHNYIGTEHILLGLVRENQGIAAQVLTNEPFNIDFTDVRDEVVGIIGQGEQAPGSHIPFTPRAKKVLELALKEALGLGHNYIGTEHILLGLIREGEGVAAQVLVNRGVDLKDVRQGIVKTLNGPETPAEPTPTPSPTILLNVAYRSLQGRDDGKESLCLDTWTIGRGEHAWKHEEGWLTVYQDAPSDKIAKRYNAVYLESFWFDKL